jgi:hypothetical protein
MSTPHYFQGNRLLDALSFAEKIRIYPQLERILLPSGFTMYDWRLSQRYVYFPAGAVISLQCLMTNGNAGETAAVGNEGMVGTASSWAQNPRSVALLSSAQELDIASSRKSSNKSSIALVV